MDKESNKTAAVLVFDPLPTDEVQESDSSISTENASSRVDSRDKESAALLLSADKALTKILPLPSWLYLLEEASTTLKHIDNPDHRVNNNERRRHDAEYFQMDRKTLFRLTSHVSSSNKSLAKQTPKKSSSNANHNVNIPIIRLLIDLSPRITWATETCSQTLNNKLAIVARAEHLKAVNSTFGGAYATLQRSGWATLFAKRQLAVAQVTGDQQLALRATVYLEICKITSILFPEYKETVVYEEEPNKFTTRTNQNARASQASAISLEQRKQLMEELQALSITAKAFENDEVAGIIEYGMHRVRNAKCLANGESQTSESST